MAPRIRAIARRQPPPTAADCKRWALQTLAPAQSGRPRHPDHAPQLRELRASGLGGRDCPLQRFDLLEGFGETGLVGGDLEVECGIRAVIGLDPPPHFHARHADGSAKVRIDTVELIDSTLPLRHERFVLAWAEMHHQELLDDWSLARAGETLQEIEPLQ